MKEDGTFARHQAEVRQRAKGLELPPPKVPRAKQASAAAAAHAASAAAAHAAEEAESALVPEIPHTILFLENLPKETTHSMVVMLFQQLAGFKEVRPWGPEGGRQSWGPAPNRQPASLLSRCA